jgi:uncharacterized protein (TIGR03086 family)
MAPDVVADPSGVDLPAVHAEALRHTRDYVAGVGASQWSEPSVCDGWSVRELTNHVVSGNFWVPELVGGKTIDEVGDRLDGDVLGDDPTATYDASADVAAAAFQGPGAMEAPVAVSYGPVPGSVYCGHRFVDVLIHGWDVAVSTGQDATLPSDLVEACWAVVEPELDELTGSGMFGTRVDVGPDADRQTGLLAVLGRGS